MKPSTFLPPYWEISGMSVKLTDMTDPEDPQILSIDFIDYLDKFCARISSEKPFVLSAKEMEQFSSLMEQTCRFLHEVREANDKTIKEGC